MPKSASSLQTVGERDLDSNWAVHLIFGGRGALKYFVDQGRLQDVRNVVAAGYDVNWQHEEGGTALHGIARLISCHGHSEEEWADLCEALLHAGIDPHAKDRSGATALTIGRSSVIPHVKKWCLTQGELSSSCTHNVIEVIQSTNVRAKVRFLAATRSMEKGQGIGRQHAR